jgi:hypothetical protein
MLSDEAIIGICALLLTMMMPVVILLWKRSLRRPGEAAEKVIPSTCPKLSLTKL